MRCSRLALVLLAGMLPLLAAACGSSSSEPKGLVITGPGLSTGQPPWKPEFAHLAERSKEIGLPEVGNEKFHIHAALHIYKNGLLVAVPAEIGLVPAKHLLTSLHTHDSTGIIHMETVHPYKFTLGDFFKVWGVKLGPAQVGGLKGAGGDKLHFYVNGKPVSDPAAYVMHRRDNIVIGYGPENSFPHNPGTKLLQEVEEGKAGLCNTSKTAKTKSCVAAASTGATGATGATGSTGTSTGSKSYGTGATGTTSTGTGPTGTT